MMGPEGLKALLEAVAAGLVPPDEAAERLASLPYADLGDLRIDHHREIRTSEPEVIYAAGKTPDQCARGVAELLRGSDGAVLATRAEPAHAAAIAAVAPHARHDPVGRVVVARSASQGPPGVAAVLAAGTSDLPVARECTSVLEAFGVKVDLVADVGVAGLHRVMAERDRIDAADVVVAVAGMEGALPTIVAGLTGLPVIAVPTSVGYGAAFGGLAALLGMLTSCAPGVVVTNIDNGFGAAMVALRILRLLERGRESGLGARAGLGAGSDLDLPESATSSSKTTTSLPKTAGGTIESSAL